MCDPVEDLSSTLNGTTVNLMWNAPSNTDAYLFEVYRNTKLVATTEDISFSETISKSGKYTYSIRAVYEDCSGTFENVTVEVSTGINENTNIDVEVYPNPSYENFTIVCNEMTKISIYNIIGTLIMDSEVNSNSYIVDNLKAGVYFFNIETANGNIIRKVIKL